MSGLPPSLARYLMGTTVSSRHPAWLLVDKDGGVREAGGCLDTYGIDADAPAPLSRSVPFLEGLLPLEQRSLIIPMVEMETGRSADVHLIPAADHDAVLLLDATAETRRLQAAQQEFNELRLRAREQHAGALRDMVAAVGMLVLERVSETGFKTLGLTPAWARSFSMPGAGIDPVEVDLAEMFPYLESFLPDAEVCWSGEGEMPLHSGVWTEELDDGTELTLEARAVRAGEGRSLLIVEHLGTEFSRIQALVQQAREQALEHHALLKEVEKKEILLHCIVHDLKSPLTSLTSSLWLLASGTLDEKEMAATAELGLRQGQRQERMITSILEVFAGDLGVDEGPPPKCDLRRCLEEEAEGFAPSFRREGVHLETEVADGPEGFVVPGESGRLGRVLANLIENALRHTPTGGNVLARLRRQDGSVFVDVENDGDVVPVELRAKLFDRFHRDPHSGGAAGLGLFYCRITLERWGGGILYAPRPGEGSRFTIFLPVGH